MTGIGYGKVILFGEHYVVYGNGSIASGISSHITAELVPGTEPGFKITDNRHAAPGYKEKYRCTRGKTDHSHFAGPAHPAYRVYGL